MPFRLSFPSWGWYNDANFARDRLVLKGVLKCLPHPHFKQHAEMKTTCHKPSEKHLRVLVSGRVMIRQLFQNWFWSHRHRYTGGNFCLWEWRQLRKIKSSPNFHSSTCSHYMKRACTVFVICLWASVSWQPKWDLADSSVAVSCKEKLTLLKIYLCAVGITASLSDQKMTSKSLESLLTPLKSSC